MSGAGAGLRGEVGGLAEPARPGHPDRHDHRLPLEGAAGELGPVVRGEGRRPRASEQVPTEPVSSQPTTPAVWQPLSDDEATGEALLSSLKRAENAPDGEPGPGRPGLN